MRSNCEQRSCLQVAACTCLFSWWSGVYCEHRTNLNFKLWNTVLNGRTSSRAQNCDSLVNATKHWVFVTILSTQAFNGNGNDLTCSQVKDAIYLNRCNKTNRGFSDHQLDCYVWFDSFFIIIRAHYIMHAQSYFILCFAVNNPLTAENLERAGNGWNIPIDAPDKLVQDKPLSIDLITSCMSI